MNNNPLHRATPQPCAILATAFLVLAAFAGSTRPFAIGAIGALTLSLA